MNDFILRGGIIADPESPWNGKAGDILIVDGTIRDWGSSGSFSGHPEIDITGMYVMPGWVDSGAFLQSPGHEDRETLHDFLNGAADCGFTDVITHVHSSPSADFPEVISSIQSAATPGPVRLHLLGNISRNKEGKDLSSHFEMVQAGAIGFSDGAADIEDSGLLLRALQYSSSFGARIFLCPVDQGLSSGLVVYEGELSARMGLKGIPVFSESLRVQRDRTIQQYAGGEIVFTGISTYAGLEAAGESSSCVLWLPHLSISAEEWASFPSDRKVFPPIPPGDDAMRLLNEVRMRENVLLATAHNALSREDVDHDFLDAGTGVAAYPGAAPFIWNLLSSLGASPAEIAHVLSVRPRTCLGLEPSMIRVGAIANMTIFAPSERSTMQTKYPNDAYAAKPANGRVAGTICRGRIRMQGA